jgi:hypothetical protein
MKGQLMDNPKTARWMVNAVVALWICHGLMLTAATMAQVSPSLVADLAKDKGIIWLALSTAITAITANVWLVKQIIKQNTKTADAINKMTAEFAKRPCFYADREKGPQ